MEEWVLTGFSRQREQVCSEGRPGRLAGELRDDLVGLAVDHLKDLGANQLLGRDMEPGRCSAERHRGAGRLGR